MHDSKDPVRSINWEHLDVCTFFPQYAPVLSSEESNTPRTVKELNIGRPPHFLKTYYIDGLQISPDDISFNFKATGPIIGHKLSNTCINVKLDTETWQFIPLENYFNSNEISAIADWVTNQNTKLLNIGSEFEGHERQIYHFLYEIIAMFYAFKNISKTNQQKILGDIQNATSLYHNRILAEIMTSYEKKGACVESYQCNNLKKPDLKISNIWIEIKTILIVEKERRKLMHKFAHKLRKDIIEREVTKQQIEKNGSFFIGIWSGIINSILHIAYNDGIIEPEEDVKFYNSIPPLNEKKAIFVMPTSNSFQNNYLVFDRYKICDIIDNLAYDRYDEIQEGKAMRYLLLNNIRKGCEFGVTGNNPGFVFKFR